MKTVIVIAILSILLIVFFFFIFSKKKGDDTKSGLFSGFVSRHKEEYVYEKVDENYDDGSLKRSFNLKITKSIPDGKVLSQQIDGKELYYYPSGSINRENMWSKGTLNGKFTVYYEDGEIYITGCYKNGKLKGDYIVYDKNQKIIWSKTY